MPQCAYPLPFIPTDGCGALQLTLLLLLSPLVPQKTSKSTAINTPGYDHIGQAMLSSFQIVTLSGWSFVMSRTMAATSPLVFLYFFALVLIGGFFVVSLSGRRVLQTAKVFKCQGFMYNLTMLDWDVNNEHCRSSCSSRC